MHTMIVTITRTRGKSTTVDLLLVPLRSSYNDEVSIKHVIEANKNNPSVLIAIVTQHVPRTILTKPNIEKLRKVIEECDSIEVKFLDHLVLKTFTQNIPSNTIFHNFSKN